MRPDDQIEEKASDCVQPETTIPIPEDLYSTRRSRMKSKYETIGGFFLLLSNIYVDLEKKCHQPDASATS